MPVHKEFSSMEAPCFSVNAAEQLSVTDGAPPHSVDQGMKFDGTSDLSSYNVGNSNIPSMECLPSFPCFGSESLSEIMDSFVLRQGAQMTSSLCSQELPSTTVHGTEKNFKERKRKRMPECGIQSNFPIANHRVESKQQKDVPTENDENQQTSDASPGVKENGNANKENYIHVRAKHGQATNSHSLAERVRREKISERMKLLQDLVPGCNKITGKAVMLDEIINYVQSLQRQVEFLSMKLAAVNPETNLDMEQIFSKESIHARFGSSPTLGNCPQMQAGMALPSLTNYRGILRTTINHQISPMVQLSNPWDFQNAIQLGLIPNIPHDAMDLTGSMKVDW